MTEEDLKRTVHGEYNPEGVEKIPIFINRNLLEKMKKILPFQIYDQLEIRYELGLVHNMLGHKNYKEEVETIMKAKRILGNFIVDYKIKHK